MKIRNAFVSNSSSSSFVLLGVEINNNYSDQEIKDIMNRAGYNYCTENIKAEFQYDFSDKTHIYIHSGVEDGIYENKIVAGYRLADGDECSFSIDDGIPLSKIKEMDIKLKYIFNTNQDVKLYAGTRMS